MLSLCNPRRSVGHGYAADGDFHDRAGTKTAHHEHVTAYRAHIAPRRQTGAPPCSVHYLFGRAGRQLRLGPIAFWTIVGTLVIMAGWTLVTATYFAFREEVLTRLIAREAEMQSAYEDRLAELRMQVDRVTGRQLLDQEQFEQKIDQLLRQQATLEARANTLSAFADPAITGSIKPQGTPSTPAPTSHTRNRSSGLEPRGPKTARANARAPSSGYLSGRLAQLQESLERMEARQSATLNLLATNFEGKARRMRSVMSDLGLPVTKAGMEATGGPFVPVRTFGDGGFERQLQRVHLARANVELLTHALNGMPIRRPTMGELDESSGFGVRTDPFLGRPAMHTGVDLRGDPGDPVRATAGGTVVQAGWSGGYGKMVEVDHGNGVSTRYGHLSEVSVMIGQKIKIGQLVGRVGSTGRSTGPHLHYETRIGGDAVDPQKFLHAGETLGIL